MMSSFEKCVGECVWECVLPQVDGADVSLDAGSATQHLATVLPQALEHHLHGVLTHTHTHTRTHTQKSSCSQTNTRLHTHTLF